MTRLFLECAVRAALIVIGTAIVLYLMRVKVAAVKHRVWTAVLVLMLVLPVWTAWGPKAQLRLLPASAERFASAPIATPTIPDGPTPKLSSGPTKIAQPPRRLFASAEETLLAVYFLGLLTLLVRLIVGTAKANRLIREASLVDGIVTSNSCVSPVTVGCLRPTVILPVHWRTWPRQQLDVVLAHEGEHVRRRDPLVQWLALFNRAVFWFHPAAWWLERELSALAEEACDAAVIASGHDPHDYAEILMSIARDVMDSGSRINSVAVAMPGPGLPHRIRSIVNAGSPARLSRLRAVVAATACAVFCATFSAASFTHTQDAAKQDWERAAGGKMSFEAASIKQNTAEPTSENFHSNINLSASRVFSPSGGFFSASNQWFIQYVIFAFKLTQYQEKSLEKQLPTWAGSNRYDIQARAAVASTKDQYRLMMQSLLMDRFKLAAHFEAKNASIFDLVIDKPGRLGPRLRIHPTDQSCQGDDLGKSGEGDDGFPLRCGLVVPMKATADGRFRYGARNASIAFVADWLMSISGSVIDRPVIDKTGLGNVDFTIEYAPYAVKNPEFTVDANAPTFLEALRDQLGLRLQSADGQVNMFVLDHIEQPTPN